MRAPVKAPAICAGKDANGTACEKDANPNLTIDGTPYCTRHGNQIIKHQQHRKNDVETYKRYQEEAFGAIVSSWSLEHIRERRDELVHIMADYPANDLHFARLASEARAIGRELERRRETT